MAAVSRARRIAGLLERAAPQQKRTAIAKLRQASHFGAKPNRRDLYRILERKFDRAVFHLVRCRWRCSHARGMEVSDDSHEARCG